jgi:hypothetical protein
MVFSFMLLASIASTDIASGAQVGPGAGFATYGQIRTLFAPGTPAREAIDGMEMNYRGEDDGMTASIQPSLPSLSDIPVPGAKPKFGPKAGPVVRGRPSRPKRAVAVAERVKPPYRERRQKPSFPAARAPAPQLSALPSSLIPRRPAAD